jgi:hypothetical protein
MSVVGRPYAATQPTIFSGAHDALLGGMAVPNGLAATAWFEWGQKGNFDHATAGQDIGAGASVVRLTAPVSNLLAGTVYQCRLVASNAATVSFGATRWFGNHDLGKITAWGDNSYNQTRLPRELTNVVAVAAGGGYHSLALKADGTVMAWGWNAEGETNVPSGLSGVVAIGAGDHHSLALRSDGTVAAWGWNNFGETNVPPGLSNVIAVTGGGDQSLALKADGTVVAWGANGNAEATVPADLSNVVAIAGGWHHSMALKADGTVVGWGNDSLGQAESPPELTNAVAIAAAGGDFTLALRADGTVFAWGSSYYGESQVPAGLSNVIAIGACSATSLALRADSTLVGWGDNSFGELRFPGGLTNIVAAIGGSTHVVAMADNLPPTALGQAVSGYPNHDLVVGLRGADLNGDTLGFQITGLPALGGLYQFAGGTRGTAIASTGTLVSDPDGHLVFAPATNSFGTGNAAFAFVANDGEASSQPANVTINIVLPPAPQLNATLSTWIPGSGFQLNFSGNSNATYRVWASTNFVDWTPLGAATQTTPGWFQFLDPEAASLPDRFYRAGAP